MQEMIELEREVGNTFLCIVSHCDRVCIPKILLPLDAKIGDKYIYQEGKAKKV